MSSPLLLPLDQNSAYVPCPVHHKCCCLPWEPWSPAPGPLRPVSYTAALLTKAPRIAQTLTQIPLLNPDHCAALITGALFLRLLSLRHLLASSVIAEQLS